MTNYVMALTLRSKKNFIDVSQTAYVKEFKPVHTKDTSTSTPKNYKLTTVRTYGWKSYGKKYNSKSQTASHRKSITTNNKIKVQVTKQFQCKVCEKVFGSNSNYERHFLGQHSGTKAFKCKDCNYSFSYKDSLNRHFNLAKSEEGGIPLQCSNCEKKFTNSRCLSCHLSLVHNVHILPLQCLKIHKKHFGKPLELSKKILSVEKHNAFKLEMKMVNVKNRFSKTNGAHPILLNKSKQIKDVSRVTKPFLKSWSSSNHSYTISTRSISTVQEKPSYSCKDCGLPFTTKLKLLQHFEEMHCYVRCTPIKVVDDKYHSINVKTKVVNKSKSLSIKTCENSLNKYINNCPMKNNVEFEYEDIKHENLEVLIEESPNQATEMSFENIQFLHQSSIGKTSGQCERPIATTNLRNKPKVVSYEETFSDDDISIASYGDILPFQSNTTSMNSPCTTPLLPQRPFVSPICELINSSPGLPLCYVLVPKLSKRDIEFFTTSKETSFASTINYNKESDSVTKFDALTSIINSYPTCREILVKLGIDPLFKSETNCVICSKDFSNTRNISSHMKTHKFKFRCKGCPKQFRDKLAVCRHYLGQHSGQRSFKCDYCDRSFAYLDTLRNHLRIHLHYKRYHCYYCQDGFLYLDSLKSHISTVHTGIRPFICKCKKSYATKTSLRNHVSHCKIC